jgi:hypothetical protein
MARLLVRVAENSLGPRPLVVASNVTACRRKRRQERRVDSQFVGQFVGDVGHPAMRRGDGNGLLAGAIHKYLSVRRTPPFVVATLMSRALSWACAKWLDWMARVMGSSVRSASPGAFRARARGSATRATPSGPERPTIMLWMDQVA